MKWILNEVYIPAQIQCFNISIIWYSNANAYLSGCP